MATKIALIGARLSTNLGGPSLLVSTKTALSSVFTNAEYTLFVPVSSYEADEKLATKYDVKVAPCYIAKWSLIPTMLRRCTGILIGSCSVKTTIKALEEADVIIDIWGILFADTLGFNTFRSRMSGGFEFVLGKILGKPVIKYTATMGPFNYKWNRIFAKLYLGHFVDFILARDETTHRCIKELCIKTPVLVVPDTAFLLPSSESRESQRYEKFRKGKPLVGLSVSYQLRDRASDDKTYIEIMKDFVNHLIAKYNVRVVIIPNELSKTADDDMQVAEKICTKANDDRCEVLHTDNLLAQEIKGVINQCEVVIAARYHTIVAALSLGIPTLAIGWHHKYMEVLKLFKQEHRVCNIEDLSFDDIIEKFENLWNDRKKAKKTIISLLPEVKERIIAGAREAHDVVLAKLK